MTPNEMGDYIVKSIYEMQHSDDDAKHIVPSTIEISLFMATLIHESVDAFRGPYWTAVHRHIYKKYKSE